MFTQVSVGTLYMSFFYFFCPYAHVFCVCIADAAYYCYR